MTEILQLIHEKVQSALKTCPPEETTATDTKTQLKHKAKRWRFSLETNYDIKYYESYFDQWTSGNSNYHLLSCKKEGDEDVERLPNGLPLIGDKMRLPDLYPLNVYTLLMDILYI